MPLEGDAKKNYQREYMRKRRASVYATRPSKEDERQARQDRRLMARIAEWARMTPWRRRGLGHAVLADLRPTENEADRREALQRYKQLLAEQREQKERHANPPKRIPVCSFCQRSEVRLAGDEYVRICRDCAVEFIDLLDAGSLAAFLDPAGGNHRASGDGLPQPP